MNFKEIQDVLQTFLLVSRENSFKFFGLKANTTKDIGFLNTIKNGGLVNHKSQEKKNLIRSCCYITE